MLESQLRAPRESVSGPQQRSARVRTRKKARMKALPTLVSKQLHRRTHSAVQQTVIGFLLRNPLPGKPELWRMMHLRKPGQQRKHRRNRRHSRMGISREPAWAARKEPNRLRRHMHQTAGQSQKSAGQTDPPTATSVGMTAVRLPENRYMPMPDCPARRTSRQGPPAARSGRKSTGCCWPTPPVTGCLGRSRMQRLETQGLPSHRTTSRWSAARPPAALHRQCRRMMRRIPADTPYLNRRTRHRREHSAGPEA